MHGIQRIEEYHTIYARKLRISSERLIKVSEMRDGKYHGKASEYCQ